MDYAIIGIVAFLLGMSLKPKIPQVSGFSKNKSESFIDSALKSADKYISKTKKILDDIDNIDKKTTEANKAAKEKVKQLTT